MPRPLDKPAASDSPAPGRRSTYSGRPRFLVLLASRNGAAAIERQIATVLAQEQVDVWIDVRDDGSTDDTVARVARLEAFDPRVRLLSDQTASGSASGNFFQLIRQAVVEQVDFVAFCDQDDEWFPAKLGSAARTLGRTGARGYSSAVIAAWPNGRERALTQPPTLGEADYLFEGFGQGCTFVLDVEWFVALRSQLAQAGTLLTKVHYHDWLVYALTRAAGQRWAFDPVPSMRYHQHADNDTGARTSIRGVLRRLGLLRDGWYRRQVDAIIAVLLDAEPRHAVALRWRELASNGSRFARFVFVARHGRRRISDRLVQMLAVGLGYL